MLSAFLETPLAALKERIIEGEDRQYSFGTKTDLDAQFAMLRQEFIGQSELALYHAWLMVLIRRRIDLAENVGRAHDLWAFEHTYLLQHLDARWLISACDTIADHWIEPGERALALAASLFANTIKLYETERLATGQTAAVSYQLPEGRVALHDGMAAFVIGRGDMIANLIGRVQTSLEYGGTGARILNELVRRASLHPTVFKRFRDVHTSNWTTW